MLSPLPSDDDSLAGTRGWPHAPPHRLAEAGVYFVTARCLDQARHFATDERRDFLLERLLTLAAHYGWRLEAWAVLANHYHVIAHGSDAPSLRKWLRHLHGDTARHVNRLDTAAGRQVWHNFRETRLTHQLSYLARLNYVHQNAVHHRLVPVAAQWRWCSAAAFEHAVTPAWAQTVASFRYDQIAAADGE
jgi:putative transposase